MNCYFVSDLHGKLERYTKLFDEIKSGKPEVLFIGGDIFPNFYPKIDHPFDDFVADFMMPEFQKLKSFLKERYPTIFFILGNDDPKSEEMKIIEGEKKGLWHYSHNKKLPLGDYAVYGYANIPPSPFIFKDWERYDVSRYVDPGCIHPTEGKRSVEENIDIEYATIKDDLISLTGDDSLENAVFLFHSPPYQTNLDRAALDGQTFDYVPLDVHVGSIAIQRFIEKKQPLLTLHGHIHESSRIMGDWKQKSGKTWMFTAAYEFPKLAIVKFNLDNLDKAERIIL
ncbi:MAG TPA: metallophosphoesterase [Bacteroidales bacterium]|nr:metallophosphoesterase [Bacteroidales bacterium]